jgi:hypothetical protein
MKKSVVSALQAGGKTVVEFFAMDSGRRDNVIILQDHYLERNHAAEIADGKFVAKVVIAALFSCTKIKAAEFTAIVNFIMVQIIVSKIALGLDVMKVTHKFS